MILNGKCIKSQSLLTRHVYNSASHPYPSGIAVGSSYVYVSQGWYKGTITIHNTSNLSLVKTFTDSSRLYYSYNIDLNASENALIVSNQYSWMSPPVVKYTVSGSTLSFSTTLDRSIYYPSGVAFDSNDNIYVASKYNSYLAKFNSSGTFQALTGGYNFGNPFNRS